LPPTYIKGTLLDDFPIFKVFAPSWTSLKNTSEFLSTSNAKRLLGDPINKISGEFCSFVRDPE
jgi:hypothetical protein